MNVPAFKVRPRGVGWRRVHHARVGDATPAPNAPAGFAPIFKGWNVWDVWQSQDPVLGIAGSIINAGESLERQLRVWVEDQIKDNAPGTAVADPLNPAALRGDQIQVLPNPSGLRPIASRGAIADLGAAVQLGNDKSAVKRYTVRFFNRGEASVMPWAHDQNYLLDTVYQPTSTDPITSSAAPSSLGGAASGLAEQAETVLKVVAIGGGLVLAVVLIAAFANSTRKAAA